jgi:HlyD family secretion protein
VLLIAGSLLCPAAGVAQERVSSSAIAAIPTARVQRADFHRTVNSIGELKAAKSSIITSSFDGKIVKLVPEGTAVKKDDPIIWLDTEEFETERKDLEAQLLLAQKDLEAAKEEFRLQELQNEYNLKSEEANVTLAEQRMADAEQKFETEQTLVERKISARSKLEEAELALSQSQVELRSAKINLQKTRENLSSNLRVKQTGIDKAQLEVERIERRIKETQEKIDSSILRAPTNGEVAYFRIWKNGSSAKVAEGDQVWPRLNLVEIPDRAQMLAVVPVNELDVAEIQPGQPAEVELDALPGRTFRGAVERKSVVPIDSSQMAGGRMGGVTTTGSGPKEFEVRVMLSDSEEFFYQGMTAVVRVITAELKDALQVPLEALTVEGEKLGVFRRDGTFVELAVVQANERRAAVEGPLADGDEVLLRHPGLNATDARSRANDAMKRVEVFLKEKRQKAGQAEGAKAPPGPNAGGGGAAPGEGRRRGG